MIPRRIIMTKITKKKVIQTILTFVVIEFISLIIWMKLFHFSKQMAFFVVTLPLICFSAFISLLRNKSNN